MGVGLGGGRVDVNEDLKFLGKFRKKIRGGGGSGWGGGQGKFTKNIFGGGGVNNELKFLGKFTNNNFGGRSGGGGGVRWGGGGSGWWGVRVDVNEELKFL